MSDHDSLPTVNGLDPRTVKEATPRPAARDLALWAVAGTVLVFPLVINPWMTRRAVKRLGRELEAAVKSSSLRTEGAIFRLQSYQDGASTSIRKRMDAIDLRMSNDSRVIRNLMMGRIRASNELERRVDALHRQLLEAQVDRSSLDEQQQASYRAMLTEIDRIRNSMESAKHTSNVMTKALGSSLADIAAFMNELELQHGFTRIGHDPRGIEKLRKLALDLEHAHNEELSSPRPPEPPSEISTEEDSLMPGEDDMSPEDDRIKEDEKWGRDGLHIPRD